MPPTRKSRNTDTNTNTEKKRGRSLFTSNTSSPSSHPTSPTPSPGRVSKTPSQPSSSQIIPTSTIPWPRPPTPPGHKSHRSIIQRITRRTAKELGLCLPPDIPPPIIAIRPTHGVPRWPAKSVTGVELALPDLILPPGTTPPWVKDETPTLPPLFDTRPANINIAKPKQTRNSSGPSSLPGSTTSVVLPPSLLPDVKRKIKPAWALPTKTSVRENIVKKETIPASVPARHDIRKMKPAALPPAKTSVMESIVKKEMIPASVPACHDVGNHNGLNISSVSTTALSSVVLSSSLPPVAKQTRNSPGPSSLPGSTTSVVLSPSLPPDAKPIRKLEPASALPTKTSVMENNIVKQETIPASVPARHDIRKMKPTALPPAETSVMANTVKQEMIPASVPARHDVGNPKPATRSIPQQYQYQVPHATDVTRIPPDVKGHLSHNGLNTSRTPLPYTNATGGTRVENTNQPLNRNLAYITPPFTDPRMQYAGGLGIPAQAPQAPSDFYGQRHLQQQNIPTYSESYPHPGRYQQARPRPDDSEELYTHSSKRRRVDNNVG